MNSFGREPDLFIEVLCSTQINSGYDELGKFCFSIWNDNNDILLVVINLEIGVFMNAPRVTVDWRGTIRNEELQYFIKELECVYNTLSGIARLHQVSGSGLHTILCIGCVDKRGQIVIGGELVGSDSGESPIVELDCLASSQPYRSSCDISYNSLLIDQSYLPGIISKFRSFMQSLPSIPPEKSDYEDA